MVEKTYFTMYDTTLQRRCDVNMNKSIIMQQEQIMTMPVVNGDLGVHHPVCVCAGCGCRIIDRYYLLAVDKPWHVNCLTCCECKLRLDSEPTCFMKDGQIYCKDDYYRRFGVKRCARCHLGISANELVMRARDLVYHLSCFTCASCNKTLATGDQFGMKDNLVYCRAHYELIFQGEFMQTLSSSLGVPGSVPTSGGGPGVGGVPFYNGVGSVQKGRPRKRKSPSCLENDSCSQNIGMGDGSDLGGDILDHDGYPGSNSRQKRVRTSFKHHQLRTMKSYFALNHNPDAKDLKQLAQKTGLSKRVLQVWFQNARAKYRRSLLKQEQGDRNGQPGSPSGDGGSVGHPGGGSISDTSMDDTGGHTLGEITNSRSPSLSEISSTPSLSDLHGEVMDHDHSTTSSLPDLFSSSIASIN